MAAVVWEMPAVEALTELASRDRTQARRVLTAVRQYAAEGRGDVTKLQGRAAEWRLRVGDWRVIFTIDSGRSITVLALRPRRDAYD